ncbi:copper amine oxidase [Nonomuraea sp. NBC_01738]|uniref:copper amine oxidase n=1 Tax=Nonomuraea sp. NBC_01738 TaxID=2976003 RepID=UPI002E122325|nr:copper amine oxidase [Nonomuraea sp. NBC_01738]
MFLQLALAAFVVAAASVTPLPDAPAPAAAETPPPCGSDHRVDQTLTNGARWQMCWEMRTIEGLTLSRVTYTPKGGVPVSVLRSAALAQIHVPYDSGEPRYHDIGSLGSAVIPLTDGDCPGGERRLDQVCVTTRPRGHAYLKDGFGDPGQRRSLQGRELVMLSAYQVGWYAYVAEFVFGDDGSITPRVGATGSLAGTTTSPEYGWPIGVGRKHFEESHSHNVFWRLDFDIQGKSRDVVEQYDFPGNKTKKRTLEKTVLTRETAARSRPTRWWRVVDPEVRNTDRHPVSWEINNTDTAQYRGPADERFTRADLYVTQYKACERLATYNAEPRCAESVDRYTDGEKVRDPVVWVNVGFHHVPRDEDADPMPVHWQGFRITPRDVTATNPYRAE